MNPLEYKKVDLVEHPLYTAVESVDDLRCFMEQHVICVWDFMTLLKSLQHELCPSEIPWVPPRDPEAARLINEIVLVEESDVFGEGMVSSHFELYVQAMEEIGANTKPIQNLISALYQGIAPLDALSFAELSPETTAFAINTLGALEFPVHVRAAIFYHAREDVIPMMFSRLVEHLRHQGVPCPSLELYLERHIECDAGEHGPAAQRLLERLYEDRIERRLEAEELATDAIQARIKLWNKTLRRIEAKRIRQQRVQVA